MKEMQVDKEPMTVESMKIAIDKIRKSSAIPTCIVSEQERQEMFKKLSMQLEEAQECCDILNMEIKEIVENEIKIIQSKYKAVSSTENMN